MAASNQIAFRHERALTATPKICNKIFHDSPIFFAPGSDAAKNPATNRINFLNYGDRILFRMLCVLHAVVIHLFPEGEGWGWGGMGHGARGNGRKS